MGKADEYTRLRMLPWEYLKQSDCAILELPLWLGSVSTPTRAAHSIRSCGAETANSPGPSLYHASLSMETDELVKMAQWWCCFPGSKTRFKSSWCQINYSRWDSKTTPKFLMCNLGRSQHLTVSLLGAWGDDYPVLLKENVFKDVNGPT